MKTLFILIFFILLGTSACVQQASSNGNMKKNIDWQGHRGCRGLLPENSIPAFIHAIDLGVNTLEMDVCISKDQQVIVTHEPWMNHVICTPKDSSIVLDEKNEREFKLFEMTTEEIKNFDCGSKGNPRFPEQEKRVVHKPSLKELFSEIETYISENNVKPIKYNIEIKSYKEWYDVFIPEPEIFTSILIQELENSGIDKNRFVLQSFDLDVLRVLHEKYPNYILALLIESSLDVEKNIEELGFTPPIYSPYFKLLNEKNIAVCKNKKMKIIPWTVNEVEDMEKLIDLGVDGIITDYPNKIKYVQ